MIIGNISTFSSKLPESGTSIFAKMTELATKHQAVNLAQGFPDFQPPTELLDFLNEAVNLGLNQYAPMPGLLFLREKIAERLLRDYQFEADVANEITITAGATQAIYTIISALIRPGDKVLIFEPAYDSYAPSVIVNGGIPVYCRLKEPDFTIPWDEFEQCIEEQNIKLIIVNNPHNPSASILSKEDVERIGKITKDRDLVILWDEVYDLLVYDHSKHYSALYSEELMTRSIVVYSLGKTLHNTGWKLGYIVAHQAFTKEIRKLHQFTVFSVNTPAQYAVAKFLDKQPAFFDELPEFYQQKRDYFFSLVSGIGMEWLPSKGSYFMLASFKKLSNQSDVQLAETLTQNNGVACIPISAFYHNGYDPKILRFCFAKEEKTLKEASVRLERININNIFNQ